MHPQRRHHARVLLLPTPAGLGACALGGGALLAFLPLVLPILLLLLAKEGLRGRRLNCRPLDLD